MSIKTSKPNYDVERNYGAELADAALDEQRGRPVDGDWSETTGGDPREWRLTDEDCSWLRRETDCADAEWTELLKRTENQFHDRCREIAESVEAERRAVAAVGARP